MNNIRVTVNEEELPIIDGKVTFSSPCDEWTAIKLSANQNSADDINVALKRLREPTTITWTIHPEETVHQPTGPVVDGSVEPLQG